MADIAGLPVTGLPGHATPIAAAAMVKALDEDGSVQHYLLRTDGLTAVEAIGMHEAASAVHKAAITRSGT